MGTQYTGRQGNNSKYMQGKGDGRIQQIEYAENVHGPLPQYAHGPDKEEKSNRHQHEKQERQYEYRLGIPADELHEGGIGQHPGARQTGKGAQKQKSQIDRIPFANGHDSRSD